MEIWLRLHWKKIVFVALLLGAAGFGFVRKGVEERLASEWTGVNQEMQSLLSASGQDKAAAASPSPPGQTAAVPSAAPAATAPPGEAATPAASTGKPQAAAPAKNGLIDINTASASRLDELPGIGPGKAQAIVAYRQANGPFRTPEELKKVKGIGQKTYDGLKDRITASAAP
ncbi:helix-hairpin-helix domain-containing protein [Paenibacillus sp. YN15]|uniref:ComEA family DNA-binding protein n=1 Tax=Paenibacillus sp. YN15 TaxID=1742774 RepID=UPI0015EC308B|nr:helix-hairpin-helix domain-containing protein [Paenibacillus sp. YN15]